MNNIVEVPLEAFTINEMSKTDLIFLIASIASLTASVMLWFNGSKESGIYVGLWVPSILGFWGIHKLRQLTGECTIGKK